VSTVVALGGNALVRPGERGTAAEQLANLRRAVAALNVLLADSGNLAITHGNGSQVGLQVILYAWATVACSLLLIPVAGMGLVYTVSALVFGGWFIYESHRLYSRAVRGTEPRPMRVFHASITYLTLLFVAIAIDPLLPF